MTRSSSIRAGELFIDDRNVNDVPRTIATLADDTFSIVLSGEWAQRLAAYGGRAVMMGVRPEDIEIAPDGVSGSARVATVRVRLDVVEPLGSEAFLSTRVGAKEITARVPPRGLPAAGREVEFAFNAERLHFFDKVSWETLWVT